MATLAPVAVDMITFHYPPTGHRHTTLIVLLLMTTPCGDLAGCSSAKFQAQEVTIMQQNVVFAVQNPVILLHIGQSDDRADLSKQAFTLRG